MVNDFVGGLIAVIAVYKLCRTPRAAHHAVLRHLNVGFVCLGLGLVTAHRLPFAGNVLDMLAAAFLALAAYAVGTPDRLGVVRRRLLAVLGIAATAMFAVGGPAVVGYEAVFFGYAGGCLVMFIVLVRGYVRSAGSLRGGLRVLVVAASVAVVWAAWSALRLTVAIPVGTALGALSMCLWLSGSALIAWRLQPRGPFRWWYAYIAYRRLTPLWLALREALPEIGKPASVHTVDFALYRRLIDIRDGQLALHAYLPPTAAEWASRAADRAGITDEPTRSAVIEAAEIAAALAVKSAGGLPLAASAPVGLSDARADLVAETAWLLAVTEAFTTSPIPAQAGREFGSNPRRSAATSSATIRTVTAAVGTKLEPWNVPG